MAESSGIAGHSLSVLPIKEILQKSFHGEPRVTHVPDMRMGDLFVRIADTPYAFFLDSSMAHHQWGQYSFLGHDPLLTLRTDGRFSQLNLRGRTITVQRNPFNLIDELLESIRVMPGDRPFPFMGGAVGYFGYDLGRWIERIPVQSVRDLPFPDMLLCFYDRFWAVDHADDRVYHVQWGDTDNRSDDMNSVVGRHPSDEGSINGRLIKRNFTQSEYLNAVQKAGEYITAGDIFQVNLSQRFTYRFDSTASALYWKLRTVNPSPFSAFMNIGSNMHVLSSSPERFLHVRDRHVHTCPIKGTRRRLDDPVQDEQVRKELLKSAKDNAELAMIVDLERNDLGRVCSYGSVVVDKAVELHSFASVHHLIATVSGRLHDNVTVGQLLKAAFPGGSIIGAPKVRAMEIIEELEPTRRSVYTGAIGYIGFDGAMDLNIAIRTLLTSGNRAWYQVGGGIVADSDPEAEYQETLDKGRALEKALTDECTRRPGPQPNC